MYVCVSLCVNSLSRMECVLVFVFVFSYSLNANVFFGEGVRNKLFLWIFSSALFYTVCHGGHMHIYMCDCASTKRNWKAINTSTTRHEIRVTSLCDYCVGFLWVCECYVRYIQLLVVAVCVCMCEITALLLSIYDVGEQKNCTIGNHRRRSVDRPNRYYGVVLVYWFLWSNRTT